MSKRVKYIVAAIVVVVIAGLLIWWGHRTPYVAPPKIVAPKVGLVSITEDGFVPASLTIKTNTVVIWTNVDNSPHRIAADPYPTHASLPGLDSKLNIASNNTYRYRFTKAGTYHYHDELHPQTEGTIIVQ